MPLTQTGRLLTVTTPLGADAVLLTGFRGREELSRPFSFQLDLATDQPVAAGDLVGKAISWKVEYPEDQPRQFHGLVRSLAVGPLLGRGLREYRAEVVPWLWFLTRATDCRIFQNKSVPDILADVFGRYGFADFTNSVTGTYAAREYCVQYRESAFEFVSRLMEEEGIAYTFTFAEGKHTLVLFDAVAAYEDCAPHATVEFRPELATAEVVGTWERRFAFVSGKAAHTDYHFETPATNLLATTDTVVGLAGVAAFEQFEFPGRYTAKPGGTTRAVVRMEEEETGYDTVRGSGRCSSFRPGAAFTLTGHPLDDGLRFAVTAVDHTGSEPALPGGRAGEGEYANVFECIPAAVLFRPARLTPRPIAVGPQWAVVVGTSGEEIYCDKYGRVKVQFVWDRLGKNDENSSCWVRVTEGWAGKNWGSIYIPRIGQEVIVEFLNGDPDRPIITGRVYNATQMPPYTLPDMKTQSGIKTRSSKGGGTADFNELRFEDKKDSEDIYFHAQKDAHRVVENDDDLKVLHDQTITVTNARTLVVKDADETITIDKGNRTRTVSKGDDSLTVTTGKRTVAIESDDTYTVKTGNRVLSVDTGNDTHTVKTGNREVSVDTGNDTLTVKTGNQTIKVSAGATLIEAAQKITLKCGPSTIELTPSGITIKGPTIKVEAQAACTVKGLKTDVLGDAMLTLKGGITMIN